MDKADALMNNVKLVYIIKIYYSYNLEYLQTKMISPFEAASFVVYQAGEAYP